MEHLPSLLWLLSLPAIIFVTYKACEFALKLFSKNSDDNADFKGLGENLT